MERTAEIARELGRRARAHVMNVAAIVRTSRLRGRFAREDARRLLVDSFARSGQRPERTARAILEAVRRERVIAPITLEAWLAYYAKRLSPGLLRALLRHGQARALRRLDAGRGSAP